LIPCNGQAAAPDLQRQAGRQAACALSKIQYQRFLSDAMIFFGAIFFFFSTKIGNFFGKEICFSSLNLIEFAIFGGKF
jgi:hypothetical protein